MMSAAFIADWQYKRDESVCCASVCASRTTLTQQRQTTADASVHAQHAASVCVGQLCELDRLVVFAHFILGIDSFLVRVILLGLWQLEVSVDITQQPNATTEHILCNRWTQARQ